MTRIIQLRIALSAALAHANGPAIAAINKQILQVKSQQQLLRLEQNIILQQAHLENSLFRQNAMSSLYKLTSTGSVSSSYFLLALTKTPPSATAPVYLEEDHFFEKQKVEMSWTHRPLPVWLLRSLGIYNRPTFTSECTVSQKQKGLKWSPKIIEVI